MVPDPDRDALVVEDLTDVVRVHPVHHEGDRGTTDRRVRRTDDAQLGYLGEAFEGRGDQAVLVGCHFGHADRVEIPCGSG